MGQQETVRGSVRQLLQAGDSARALRSLLDASEAGGEPGGIDWQFALRVDRVLEEGMSATILRRLIHEGYLQQRRETTRPTDKRRRFREVHNLSLEDRSCVLLTSAGVALLRSVLEEARAGEVAEDTVIGAEAVRPHWAPRTGVLWLGERVVRWVKTNAKKLRLLLAAFQEQQWPPGGIDNPLGRTRKVSEVERLKEAIEELNAHQRQARIEFSLDESKSRVLWKILDVGGPTPKRRAARSRG